MSITISLLQDADLDQLMFVQSQTYSSDLFEARSFYTNRLALSPHSCWKASDSAGLMQGYLISYPWQGSAPPALGQALHNLPAQPDQWFIHDCALLPAARGKGWSSLLLQQGLQFARSQRLRWSSLVSLGKAREYWQAQGYTTVQLGPEQTEQLQAYGPQSCMMRKPLSA